MDILRRPAFSLFVAFVCSALYGFIRIEKVQQIIEIWAFFGIALLVLAIHELGHVICGLIVGLKFKLMTVGPITVQKKREKYEFEKIKYGCMLVASQC